MCQILDGYTWWVFVHICATSSHWHQTHNQEHYEQMQMMMLPSLNAYVAFSHNAKLAQKTMIKPSLNDQLITLLNGW